MKVLLFFFALAFISCSQKYKIKDEKVYLKGWNEGSGDYELLVEEADAKTFQTVETDAHLTIGKDDKHVFIERTMIKNFDPSSMKYVGGYYFVDSDSVYYFGAYNDLNGCEVVGANPKTFEIYEINPWAHDDKSIIYGHNLVKVNNILDFKIISDSWGFTKDKVINKGNALDSVDFETFEMFGDDTGKDRSHKWVNGKIVK